jgi:predicted nucleic acid-binding protein
MSTYLLDTGIPLSYIRDSAFSIYVDQHYAPSKSPNIACISIVTIGELISLSIRSGWGNEKKQKMAALLKAIPAIEVRHPAITVAFAEIDAYRSGRHPTRPLPPNSSARALSDNDIWIAATGAVLKATLLTTDKDFLFLDGIFLHVIYIDPSSKAEEKTK